MNTQTTNRLVRFGKVLNVVGIVLAVICLMAAVSALSLAIVVAFIPEDLIFQFLSAIRLDSAFAVFQAGTVLGDLVPLTALIGVKVYSLFILLKSFAYATISAIILFILSSLFKSTVAHRSPFLPENVKRLKIIGIILIVASVLIGWQTLIFAFSLLALAFIFQYGTELQQQADETL